MTTAILVISYDNQDFFQEFTGKCVVGKLKFDSFKGPGEDSDFFTLISNNQNVYNKTNFDQDFFWINALEI